MSFEFALDLKRPRGGASFMRPPPKNQAYNLCKNYHLDLLFSESKHLENAASFDLKILFWNLVRPPYLPVPLRIKGEWWVGGSGKLVQAYVTSMIPLSHDQSEQILRTKDTI